jgi:FlaG/FlaF family flagellin (archaellin)
MGPTAATLRRQDERAVSEVMGVTMLLAMVVTTMASVVVVLQPFMEDLTDNRDWAAGSVAATQFNDRLRVVAEAPAGTGIVVTSQHLADTIRPLRQAEIWLVSADLAGADRVAVRIDAGTVNVTSLNGTADEVRLTTPLGTDGWNLSGGEGENTTALSLTDWVQVDVLDAEDVVIHRWAQIPLDGIQLGTPLKQGTFEIDLINGARIEQLPGQPIDVRSFPRLHQDRTLDGGHRVSIILLDVAIIGAERQGDVSLDLSSLGAITFFDESARNLRIETDFNGDDSPESRYLREWTDDYDIQRTTGNLDDFVGFGPSGRVSGVDGMTLHPTDVTFHLDLILQQVVVE